MSHVNSSSVAPASLLCSNIWICSFIQPCLTAHVKISILFLRFYGITFMLLKHICYFFKNMDIWYSNFAVFKLSTTVCNCENWSWTTCVHPVKPEQWNPRPQEVACCRSRQTHPMCFPLQCLLLSLCQSVFAADWEKWWEVRAGVMNVWDFSVRLKHSCSIYHKKMLKMQFFVSVRKQLLFCSALT